MTELLQPNLSVRVGQILRGKYRVERVLGAGGMGAVVAATHLRLDRPVAIKLLRPALVGKPAIVARFAREARAAAKLKSDHVVRILDVDDDEGGEPFLVMELLQGHDLQRAIDDGPLNVARAVEYVLQACVAVAEAHAHGIVHRDLKPANLFLTTAPDGSAKIPSWVASSLWASKISSSVTATAAPLDSLSALRACQPRRGRPTLMDSATVAPGVSVSASSRPSSQARTRAAAAWA